MGSLEFLSGFNLGRLLQEAMKKSVSLEDTLGSDYERYSLQWKQYFKHEEFFNGIKIGLERKNLPNLTDNMDSWFQTMISIILN